MRGLPVFLGAVIILAAGTTLSVVVDGRALAGVMGGESRAAGMNVTPTPSYTPAPTVMDSAPPLASASPSPSTSPSPSPNPSPAVAASASPTASPATSPQATTNAFVHLRLGPSTNTAVMTDVPGGMVVKLGAYSDSSWQQVVYNGLNGYIFKSYLNY